MDGRNLEFSLLFIRTMINLIMQRQMFITYPVSYTHLGVRTYTCSCGDSYTENIPATGHSYVSKVTKAATTTEEGIMTYTCSKCGHSYIQPIAKIKSDDSNKDNGSQNQKPQSGTDNGNPVSYTHLDVYKRQT